MDKEPISNKSSEIVSLADEEAVKQIIVDTIFSLWKVVNNLTRLRPTKHPHYRVTIFGSARAKPQSLVYEQVKQTAKALASMGCDIVSGGGPGIMRAANEGAAEADALQRIRSIGIRIDLPFEQECNPFVKEIFEHGTFFTRLHHFVLASDAFIVFSGGIGSLLEFAMIWQLLQVRHIKDTPLILVGKMWAHLIEWAHHHFLLPELELADSEDLTIPICVETADEAITILRTHREEWLNRQKQK